LNRTATQIQDNVHGFPLRQDCAWEGLNKGGNGRAM
jgi:hypothetical protein